MVIIFNANSPVKAFDKTKQLCTYMYNIYMYIYIYVYIYIYIYIRRAMIFGNKIYN